MTSRRSPRPDLSGQDHTKADPMRHSKRHFRRRRLSRRNRVTAASPRDASSSPNEEDRDYRRYLTKANEESGKQCRKTRTDQSNRYQIGLEQRQLTPERLRSEPFPGKPPESSSKTSINYRCARNGSTSTSLAYTRGTSSTTLCSTDTDSNSEIDGGKCSVRNSRLKQHTGSDSNGGTHLPLGDVPRNYTSWWKSYRTEMVKIFDDSLLVSEAPSKKSSVLIQYLCSMYTKGRTKSSTLLSQRSPVLSLPCIADFLERGAGIDDQDDFGQTVLMEAARSWHVDVTRYLLDNDADFRRHDNFGRTPIHVAASVDRSDVIALLLDRGASVNSTTAFTEETPVHLAARKGAMSALSFLIEAGGDVESRDYRQRTPLYVAAAFHRAEAVSFLLQGGAKTNVIDSTGISLYVHMARNCPELIGRALDRLVFRDNIRQTSTADAEVLESSPEEWIRGVKTNILLDLIEHSSCRPAIRHPVVREMLGMRWNMFARTWNIVNIVFRMMFYLLFTAWVWSVGWEIKHAYIWPADWWRVLLPVLAILSLGWEVKIEVEELRYTILRGVTMARLHIPGLETDMKSLAHPRWRDETDYIQCKLLEATRMARPWRHLGTFLRSLWNLYDVLCFSLVLACVFTHLADVVHHTTTVARLHVELGAVVTLLLGGRLMKDSRGFLAVGQLVIMLGMMAADIGRFICLYLQLYIPFTIAFWIIFGGQRLPKDQSACSPNCTFISVNGMETYKELCFSLFRLTLVDEYDIDTMREINSLMTSVLVGGFLFTSAVIGVNFLIGLFSNALGDGVRQHVYTNTLLQRLNVVLLIEQSTYWFGPRPEKFRETLKSAVQRLHVRVPEADEMRLTTQESLYRMNEELTTLRTTVANFLNERNWSLSSAPDDLKKTSDKMSNLDKNNDTTEYVTPGKRQSSTNRHNVRQRSRGLSSTVKMDAYSDKDTSGARRSSRQRLNPRIVVSD